MKKILLTIGLIAATSAAIGQGMISFSPGTYSVSTNGNVLSPIFTANAPQNPAGQTVGLTALAANGFYYELLMAGPFTGPTVPTDHNVVDGTWKDTTMFDNNGTLVGGRINAGPSGLLVGSLVGWNATVNGGGPFGTTGTNYIMLVGWSANLGTSWAQVSNNVTSVEQNNAGYFSTISFFGETGIGWENPSTASPGMALLGGAANGGGQPIVIANGLVLNELPIPEPATFALVGLGGLSLLLFRRRN
jgi:hypothetical protein